MKKRNLKIIILTFSLLTSLFISCIKQEEEFDNNPIENLNSDSAGVGGVIFLDESEYLSLPVVNETEIIRLYPDEIELRASSLRLKMPPVSDQGREGSCVAFAAGYGCISYYLNAINKMPYTETGALRSPEYLYNLSKEKGDCLAGTIVEKALDVLKSKGICGWYWMPYTDVSCSIQPNAKQTLDSRKGRITSWGRVTKSQASIKSILDKKHPILAAMNIDQNFDNQTMKYPYTYIKKGGKVRGGHAFVIVGYDDSKKVFVAQNSWGKTYHDNGHFYIAYDLLPSIDLRLYLLNF